MSSVYDEMSLSEVITQGVDHLNSDLEKAGYDTHYPENAVVALQLVMDKADDIASGDHLAGFAFASGILLAIGEGLRTKWPEGLGDRLHGRITQY